MASINDITTGTWNIDPAHSEIGFVVRHLMVSKIRGNFTEFTGAAQAGEPITQSTVEFTVQTASVNTNNTDRDTHLRSGDFFEVEAFPAMTFRSTRISESEIEGELTIKGVTKTVTFGYEFGGIGQDPWGGVRAGFEATGQIDRTDFGLTFNAPLETGGVMLGEKITINLDLEFVRAS